MQNDVGLEALLGLDGVQLTGQHGGVAVGHHLAGGAGTLLGLLHGAVVRQEAQSHQQDHDDGQDAIQLEGDGVDDGVLASLRRGEGAEAHHQTGYIHAPSGEGEGDADGSGGAVAQPGQLLAGDLGLIGDGTHHVTHEQGGEVVGEEHQNTQRSAHDLSNAGRDVKLLIELVGHGLNGAGLLEEGHHDTDEHLDTDDPDIVSVTQSALDQTGEAEQQILTGDEQTHQNTAQDGEQGFSRNERQDNGDQSRSQRKDTIIIHIYLLKFSGCFSFSCCCLCCLRSTTDEQGQTRLTAMV